MLVSKKHKKLVLKLKNPGRITSIIPTAKTLEYNGVNLVAVPHRLDEVRVLRNMGIEAPSPVLYHYDWPGLYKPFDHQKATAAFLTTNPKSFCLNGMGTMKTMTSLWSFDFIRRQNQVDAAIVLAPLSTLEDTWGREIFKNMAEFNYTIVHGNADKCRKLLREDFDVYIANHHGLLNTEKLDELVALCKRKRILLIVDEVATFRNASTKLWKALKKLVDVCEWTWGLTGTPTPNAPTDAWAQCRLINPTTVPKYFGAFRDMVMRQSGPFKWVARDNALDTVYRVMQPAIRFGREACLDLPPTTYVTRHVPLSAEQAKVYGELVSKFRAEYAGGQINAINEAAKRSKLLQVCCIVQGTPVLTDRGWVPIQSVSCTDLVWDGVEWVQCGGSVFMGGKRVIEVHGVSMTPDHLVLTTAGWKPAESVSNGDAGKGFVRAPVRIPDGYEAVRHDEREDEEGDMAVRVHVRDMVRAGKPGPAHKAPAEPPQLRVHGVASKQEARDDRNPTLELVGRHARTVPESVVEERGELRRSWHYCVRSLARLVRGVLGRHGADVLTGVDHRQNRRERAVQPGELPVGDGHAAVEQQAVERTSRHSEGHHDSGRGSESVWVEAGHTLRTTEQVQVGSHSGTDYAPVYDILNCGPRSRFVVMGSRGVPLIVHNCGVAYGSSEDVIIPAPERVALIKEIIEQADAKVIIFVPFTGALRALADEIGKDYSVHVVDGGVSNTQRGKIFADFRDPNGARVLVAQAASMSHGLNLTVANTIVWFGPAQSNDVYEQANARVPRPGQKLNTFIIHIESSPVERKSYERLQSKSKTQGILLDMFEGLDN